MTSILLSVLINQVCSNLTIYTYYMVGVQQFCMLHVIKAGKSSNHKTELILTFVCSLDWSDFYYMCSKDPHTSHNFQCAVFLAGTDNRIYYEMVVNVSNICSKTILSSTISNKRLYSTMIMYLWLSPNPQPP